MFDLGETSMQEGDVGRIVVCRIFEDEDLMAAIKKRAEESGVKTGAFIVIGSLKNAVLGYYRNGKYEYVQLDGPLEIASGLGNIAVGENGEVMIHVHVVVSDEKCRAFGGHLVKDSHVGATAELVIVEGLGLNVQRGFDEKTKLNLLKLS
jgi:predicted DNA-binding protein with PD1-like motif